jgi:CRP/FNR family cyclic AMP-dependent transcriptional regulator
VMGRTANRCAPKGEHERRGKLDLTTWHSLQGSSESATRGGAKDQAAHRRVTARRISAVDFDKLWAMADELRDVVPIELLTEDERRAIVARMRARSFRAGEVVYHRGDPGMDAFLVHHGLLKSLLVDSNGRELVVGLHSPGDFVGTGGLFREAPRESTVVAILPATLLQIPRADARQVLERNPQAMYFMYDKLLTSNDELTAQLENVVFLRVAGRVARYIVELKQRQGISLTQDDFAAAIGATREQVNRTLADFERRGLIRLNRRAIEILDEPALRREIQQ